jgi:VanZ family protein
MSLSNAQPQPRQAVTGRPLVSRFGPRRCAGWLLLYALIVVYSSLVLGPLGFHFVPHDPAAAWRSFLATRFLDNGSDQRPDWIANLLMMVPFGLLATGALGTGRSPTARVLGSALALLISLGFVLAVKYAQLFFPPRTVSLNYIVAQSIGAVLGVGLFYPLRAALRRRAAATDAASRLRHLLDAATLGFVAFALFPFDVALSTQDIAARFANLPSALLSLPNAGRPLGLQIVLLVATAIAAMPLGMRLVVQAERPALAQIAATGAALLAMLFGATLFILSAKVSVATFGLRLLGVVAGAMLLRWLAAHDPRRLRYQLGRTLPFLLPIYLLLLVYANGLLTRAWVTPEQALAGLKPHGLLPLWYDYISSKSHAVESTVVHVAMYAPIGVMIWLRRGGTSRPALVAGAMGASLALMIELGRGLKPGVQPDFNVVLIGAIAAAAANRVMALLWPSLLALPALVPPDASPAERAASTSPAARATSATPAARAATWIAVAELPVAAWLPLRLVLAAICLASAAALAWEYPLGGWQALAALAAWVAVLWLRPALWFIMLPAIMPSLDLAPWTGWIAVSEADIAVLATVAVLLLRAPPSRQDLWPDERVRLFARFVLALVTFARTAYMATFASMVTTCCGWTIALRRRRNPLDWLGGALIGVAVVIALIAGLNTDFMRYRVARVWTDLTTREANWGAGLDRRDRGLAAFLLGMGTGSYPRFAALRSPPDQQPGTYVVRHDGTRSYLATMFGPEFYFGQKVPVVRGETYTMMFDMRAPVAGTGVSVHLCSKLLLYSADCHVLHLTVGQAEIWQHVSAPLPAPIQRGRLPAPVELAFATGPGVLLDLAGVQLVGPDGRNVVANGDFAAGTARWFFTSDYHRLWRIFDSPLSIWFEGGVLGTVAVTLLVVSALGGAAQAIRRGESIGAPIDGAMLAVLLCGCFDNIFEAPRIALLFDLVAMLGLLLGWPPRAVARRAPSRAPPPPHDVVRRRAAGAMLVEHPSMSPQR